MASVTEFGAELLRTGDLDPVYVALHKAKLDRPLLERLCLAYWCFYHLGLAAFIAEKGVTPRKFWDLMMRAAVNEGDPKPFPRGAERRHYRGAQAVQSMEELIAKYPKGASDAVAGFYGIPVAKAMEYFKLPHRMTFQTVSSAVQTHRGFGEWIAFKIADMGERVLGLPVDFSDCALGVYKDPRQGAAVAFLEWKSPIGRGDKPWEWPITDGELRETIDHYVHEFRAFKAPPDARRKINVQEVETIFCKYKSHLKGHYPMGKDTREIKHGLHAQGWGKLAEHLWGQL